MPAPRIGAPTAYHQKWNFKVEVDGVVVGGFNKAGPLKQTAGMAEQHEGGAPTAVDYSVTKYKTEKVTFERGASDNDELWQWWSNQKRGVIDKRNVSIAVLNAQGTVTTRYNLPMCIMLEFDAGEFDGKNETENVVEKMVLQPLDLDRTPGP